VAAEFILYRMNISLVLAFAYLLGSIPFGYLIVRATQKGDVRETGSGGTGATNVTRRAGKSAGILTLILDAVKGASAVLLAWFVLGAAQPMFHWVAAAGFVAIVGHCFPVWLGFRGGKGVATMIGVFLVLAPAALALAVGLFFAVVALTRYVSLGSILAALSLSIFATLTGSYLNPWPDQVPIVRCAVAVALLVVIMHRENIARLLAGTESKFK
jgi:glycerol-3-phosphate acyltransferase PlsY